MGLFIGLNCSFFSNYFFGWGINILNRLGGLEKTGCASTAVCVATTIRDRVLGGNIFLNGWAPQRKNVGMSFLLCKIIVSCIHGFCLQVSDSTFSLLVPIIYIYYLPKSVTVVS